MARRYSKTRNEGFKEALDRAPAPASGGGAQANGRRPGKARASAAGARGLEGVLAHPVEALVAASRPAHPRLGVRRPSLGRSLPAREASAAGGERPLLL